MTASSPLTSPLSPIALPSDGTNQGQRSMPCLNPQSVSLDERTLADFLDFTLAYSAELNYYGPDNLPHGDWSGFLNPDGLDEKDWAAQRDALLQWLDSPSQWLKTEAYRRPHLLLFMAYLKLLQLGQQQLNQLTQRHLDFYYQEFLRLSTLPGVPDSVNVLVSLASNTAEALLPAGTLLAAGKDSAGNPLSYATQADLLVNMAQVQQLSTVFVNKQITGFQQARELCTKTPADALMDMLAIPYGSPNPGGLLPPYPIPVFTAEGKAAANISDWTPGVLQPYWQQEGLRSYLQGKGLYFNPQPWPVTADNQPDNSAATEFLNNLLTLTQFVAKPLYMEFNEFRVMMRCKDRQGIDNPVANANWDTINDYLGKAGITRTGNSNYVLSMSNTRDFDSNLDTALGGAPDFSTLPQIETIYDLYDQRGRADVQAYIPPNIYLSLDDFTQMMQIKVAIDSDWQEVNNLLARAGQRQRQNTAWMPGWDDTSPDFATNLNIALGVLDFSSVSGLGLGEIGTLNQFNLALQCLEGYFYCPAADFVLLMDTWNDWNNNQNPSQAEWDTVYAKLQSAYVRKIQAQREKQLWKIQQSDGQDPSVALTAMLCLALGQPADTTAQDLLDQLSVYLSPTGTVYPLIQQAMQPGSAPLNSKQWVQIINTLVSVWRSRLGSDPVPQQVEWICLDANANATSVQAQSTGNSPRWRTFGQQDAPPQGQPTTPEIGWVIASPLLCLSQGTRSVELVLGFDPDSFDTNAISPWLPDDNNSGQSAFLVQVSGANGWITLTPSISIVPYDDKPDPATGTPMATGLSGLSFTFTLSESDPSLVASASNLSRWPLLRLLLQSAWEDNDQGGNYVTPYPLFSSLALERVWLGVGVQGLTGLQMQNDEGALDASKPFEPFGSSPSAGSSFCFAHGELAVKCLSSITLNFQWMKVPDTSSVSPSGDPSNLAVYYNNYPALAAYTDNSAFTFQFSMMDQSSVLALDQTATLFAATDAGAAWPVNVPVGSTLPKSYAYVPDTTPCNYANPSAWRRYWRLELNKPDFQQDAYASLATSLSVQFAAAIAAGTVDDTTDSSDKYTINTPYTPKLKTFSVDYQAAVEVVMAQYPSGVERIYHHQALSGFAGIQADADGFYRILPAYDNEGELYIGLQGVVAPQEIAILFQMADGSANPDMQPQPVSWSYLSGNQWLTLQNGQLLHDGTHGFTGPGIIRFQLTPALPNTLLPFGLYWLRASVVQGCDSLCDTVAILTQAVCATWVDQNNAADHLDQPLPVQTITKTVNPVAGIASISQPYTSFGGKPAEDDSLFYTRVSERLRHKQRAVTFWDYEQLILQQFPWIYTAKCIPPTLAGTGGLGQVAVVVIPDIRNNQPFNPFAPKVSAGMIEQIQAYLADYLPPLAELVVQNPYYVLVRVRFAVRFMPGCEPDFYLPQLSDALDQFLSPWAYGDSSEVPLGGKIYANNIIDYLERLSYVNYLANMELFKSEDGLTYEMIPIPNDGTGYCVQADNPDGVLVSAQMHDIDLITDRDYAQEDFSGIGYMKIQLDFEVA